MKSLLAMIGTGLCALVFTACATEPPPVNEEVLNAADALPIPPDGQPLSADPDPATPDAACSAFAIFAGGTCPAGFTCLWKNSNFGGEIVGVSRGCVLTDLTQVPCPSCNNGTFNDQMSSWQNRSGGQSCWWFNIHRSGTRIVMPNGDAHANTSPGNNDQASSFGTCS